MLFVWYCVQDQRSHPRIQINFLSNHWNLCWKASTLSQANHTLISPPKCPAGYFFHYYWLWFSNIWRWGTKSILGYTEEFTLSLLNVDYLWSQCSKTVCANSCIICENVSGLNRQLLKMLEMKVSVRVICSSRSREGSSFVFGKFLWVDAASSYDEISECDGR